MIIVMKRKKRTRRKETRRKETRRKERGSHVSRYISLGIQEISRRS
jgi:hypothetical protein